MAIFKYFSHEEHALALINKGQLMLQPLSHFREREADGIRGDPHDGRLIYKPPGGLTMNMEDGRAITLEDGSFRSSVNQNDIFVYCASNQLSANLAEMFGLFCVELAEPQTLVNRLKSRAHPSSQFDYQQIVHGKVDYRELGKEPGVDWALPERLVLIKPESFAWQDEFRIALGKRGTMNVENVGVTIEAGPVVQILQPVPAPIFLRIGPLAKIATLHRFA